MKPFGYLIIAVMMVFVAGNALAQDFIIYPAKGQSQEQTDRDKYECYSWAKQQTGFDPMQMPTATEAPPSQKAGGSVAGGVVKGGLVGAGVGAGVGAIAGGGKGALTGAAIGGVAGGLLGGAVRGSQKKQDEQAQQQWADQQGAQYMEKRNTYNRAYCACLEGRGYSVK
jgi:predicted lipid-binding transport protein (Tim44 family)